eukprot:m.20925 g.20925  ORF g.20925 m.20925 type:complete len:75 (+) comp13183_c0_seq1:1431-1655(+)
MTTTLRFESAKSIPLFPKNEHAWTGGMHRSISHTANTTRDQFILGTISAVQIVVAIDGVNVVRVHACNERVPTS